MSHIWKALLAFGATVFLMWRIVAWHDGRVDAADSAGYERALLETQAAQAQARADNIAEVRAIEDRDRRNSDAVRSSYERDLTRLRGELMRPRASTHPGVASSAATAPASAAAGGAAEAPGLCLTPDELLLAAENELRHDRLIDWIEGQKETSNATQAGRAVVHPE